MDLVDDSGETAYRGENDERVALSRFAQRDAPDRRCAVGPRDSGCGRAPTIARLGRIGTAGERDGNHAHMSSGTCQAVVQRADRGILGEGDPHLP